MEFEGRCYCGQAQLKCQSPRTVLYCHCDYCRRAAGAPVTPFAEFEAENVDVQSEYLKSVSVNAGVTRWFCGNCGSPIMGTYDYLPNMTYVSLGVLNDAEQLEPVTHAHFGSKYAWLHIADDLPKENEYRMDE